MRWVNLFLLTVLATPALSSPAASAVTSTFDLALVIAADTSSSIDDRESALEREGVASAFRSPEILRAISSGSLGRIAVLYLDWSGGPNNRIVVNWRTIRDKASALAFADAVQKAPRTYGRGTAMGAALQMGAALLETSGFDATRKVIDVSGDGPNNTGQAVAEARQEVLRRGIIVNGLPIMSGDYGTGDWGAYPGQLDQYYMHCVIGGPGSFIVPARGFEGFVLAMRRKLVLEISDAGATAHLLRAAAQTPQPNAAPPDRAAQDCGTGGFGRGFRGFGRF
jgi:hypothetical protein